MSDCPACAKAREHPTSGIFQTRCDGCSARALAQSPAFHGAEAHLRVKEWVTPKTG